ncbi:CBS domain-containing protein [Haloarchaeobius sp. TZWWS8]|uniref:CBS domain-containing protein n=1 Tax=Haloarchaeobius sp. TZWWS8 TaxID=3446121 RepID=UPI003EBA2FC7
MPTIDIARKLDEVVRAQPDSTIQDIATKMNQKMVGSVVIHRDEEPVGIVTDRDIALKVVGEGKDPASVTARDVMSNDPVTIEASAGVAELCEKMREESVRRMPVTENGKLVGIVTLDDLMVLLDGEMNDLTDVIRAESPAY